MNTQANSVSTTVDSAPNGGLAVSDSQGPTDVRLRDQPFTLAHWAVTLPDRDVTAEEASGPLSDEERQQLAECHRAVDNARSARWMLGMSLEIVRRRRLHRGDGTRTWVQYLTAEHDGMTERDARRMQDEWRLAKTVHDALGKPAPSSHVRAMLDYAASTSDAQAAADYVRLRQTFELGSARLAAHQITARVTKAIEFAATEADPRDRVHAVVAHWRELQTPRPVIPAPSKAPDGPTEPAPSEEVADPLAGAVHAAERALNRVDEALMDESATLRRTAVEADHLERRLRKIGRILAKATVPAVDIVDAEIVEG
ncbi:hypothetical protein ACIOEX_11125 [Streptomyces sp. NPDC087850]|uniref:hypothetical protein n=1 Tax=Streptomyces sp. NPDC087850 TaxID=3365809 RepID=UPI0038262522